MDISQSLDANKVLNAPFFHSKFLNPGYLFNYLAEFFSWLFHAIFNQSVGDLLQGILIFLAIFFIAIIAYTVIRMFEIRAKEHKHLQHEIAEYAHYLAEKEKKLKEGEGISKNLRWIKVLEYLSSVNANDWKLAIIEADSMLDGLVGDLGFKGENLGEKLKNADRDKFRSLTSAWEVHTIRNRIAHEGEGFNLSLHEARRVIALYEQIFREFGYI